MNNLQFATMIVGFIALLLSLWGGAWLNQRGLERQMEAFRAEVKAELARMSEKVEHTERQLSEKVDHIEQQLSAKVDHTERQLTEKVARIERQLERIFQPVLPK